MPKAGEAEFGNAVLVVPFGDRRPERHRLEVSTTRERCRTRWVAGSAAGIRRRRTRRRRRRQSRDRDLADGSKLEGTLVRKDDFLVVLTLPDGTRKSIARNDGVPKVDVKDPNEAHKKMVLAARRSGEQEDARRHRLSVAP